MAKYSTEFKMKVVKEYLESSISYKSLSGKYCMSSEIVITWVNAYKSRGYEGLKTKKRGKPSTIPKSQKKSKNIKAELSANITNL